MIDIMERLKAYGWLSYAEAIHDAWDCGHSWIPAAALDYGYRVPIRFRVARLDPISHEPLAHVQACRAEFRKEATTDHNGTVTRIVGRVGGCDTWVVVVKPYIAG